MTDTVTVACKHPAGLQLRLFEYVKRNEAAPGGVREETIAREVDYLKNGQRIWIKGFAHAPNTAPSAQLSGGYALTPGVPRDIWLSWLEQNKDSAIVRNGLIFAEDDTPRAVDHAHNQRGLKSGLEPMLRDGSGEMIDERKPRPLNPATGSVETGTRG